MDKVLTTANAARALAGAPDFVRERHVRNCWLADPDYGRGVARALGVDIVDLEKA